MTTRHIVNRGLPERSKLQFFFPNTIEAEEYFVVTLPFFENPRIRERKKARYQSYQTISRSSNLYSYLGADSRQFTVEFNMTLDHILDSGDIQMERYMPMERGVFNQESARSRFFKQRSAEEHNSPAGRLASQFTALSTVKDSARQVMNSDFMQRGALSEADTAEYISNKYGVNSPNYDPEVNHQGALLQQTDNFADDIHTSLGSPQVAQTEVEDLKLKAIDVIIYWVNIIRSSVIGHAGNPLYGPPIVRLTHGILYEDVPCICKDYSLSYNENAGFNLETLLPRQIKITMKLEENRTGDFGVFDATNQNTRVRDNLAGWESVVINNTRSGDPGSGGLTT
tara:strand:+ start:1263 stop:2282 length:1020 start_codon:yes stop_codon:yes gene_type:complete